MVWWILGTGFVLGLILLVLAALPVLRRLRPFALAAAGLQARQADVLTLQGRFDTLQGDIDAVRERVEDTTANRRR